MESLLIHYDGSPVAPDYEGDLLVGTIHGPNPYRVALGKGRTQNMDRFGQMVWAVMDAVSVHADLFAQRKKSANALERAYEMARAMLPELARRYAEKKGEI